MKVTVWVVSTCVPDEPDPCLPHVFGTAEAAQAHFAEMIKNEWDASPACDDDGEPVPMPEDSVDAHEALCRYWGHEFGRWEITSHTVEI